MRLTVLTTSYPLTPDSYSGIFVQRMIAHLPDSTRTTVIAPAGKTDRLQHGPGNIRVRLFPYAPKRFQVLAHEPGGIPVALHGRPWTYLLLPTFLLSMLAYCFRHTRQTDVIHANWSICGVIAGIVGALRKTPVVTTLRGEDVTRARHRLPDRMVLGLCLRFSNAVVVVSPSIEAWISERYAKLARKVRVIENGVEDVLLTVPPDSRGRNPNVPLRLLTVGSLIPRKRIGHIIEAMARLPDSDRIQLTVVGAGPDREALEQLAQRLTLGDRVTFAGAVGPDTIARLLAQADAFVLASQSEGRPNVVLEAMAMALPVVATDIDGVRDVVQHGTTGLLYGVDDITTLADHLRRLCADDKLCRRLGEAGRRWIVQRGLLWSRTAQAYASLYHSVIEESAARRPA